MSEITASLVKDLRETSGAGMMDCKKALTETNGNMEAALDWLRAKGLGAAAKKATRVAAEGLIAVANSGNKAVVVEVNAETDFVGRNEFFQATTENIAKIALIHGDDVAKLVNAPYGEGRSVQEQLTHLIATIGENMNLRRAKCLAVKQGVVASYIHSAVKIGVLGKIGVLVALESSAPVADLQDLGKKIAMHIAAANPQFLVIDDVDEASLAREREITAQKAGVLMQLQEDSGAGRQDCEEALKKAGGDPVEAMEVLKAREKVNPNKKPLDSAKKQEILQKTIEGRIRKYYEEVVLLEQVFVIDGETKIRDVIAAAAKKFGVSVELTGFVAYRLGEGIEKKEDDFAAEVAQMAKA